MWELQFLDLIIAVNDHLNGGYVVIFYWTPIQVITLGESWSFIGRVITIKIKCD